MTARLTTRRLKRSVAAGAAALTLLAAAGCGGDKDSTASDSTDASSSASADASTSPSDEASSDSESNAPDAEAGEQISAEEFGGLVKKALDDATTANVTIDTSGGAAGLSGTGQVDYESEPPAVKMTATIAQMGDIDITLVDNTFYLKSSALGGDKWVEVPLDDPNSPFGALGDQLDPAASLEKLVDGVQSATFVGEEDVDGDELDHYTASVDTATLLQDLPAEAQGSSGLPATVDYEMWFDQDGLIRKFSADLGSTVGTTSGTFDDWGTDVDIEAPPASEVTQMPSLGGSTAG